jgi:peptidoglycan hydrolase-like protein with peptidoglycan-binding domain
MVGWSGGQIQLALNGRKALVQTDLESLLPHTQGAVYVYWKNTLGFDPVINANSPPQAIQAAKKMLRQVGYDNLNQAVVFDRATEKAILDFQLRHSLTPDGLVGSLTKIFLINEAQGDDSEIDRPRLYGDSDGREGA